MAQNEYEIWRLATALSGAVTPLDVAVALAEEGAAAAGAAFSNMAVCDKGRTWVIHGASLGSETAERWAELDDTVPTPLTDAIARRNPVLLSAISDIADHYPVLVDDTVSAGLVATASMPLLMADGSAAGAAGFGWSDQQHFGAEQVRTLDLITRMAASALERAALHQHNVETGRARDVEDAQLLQDIFLPRELLNVKHLEAAAVYAPASDAAMGGDWYDAFPVDGGACLVIGDVAGHGLRAAAVMVQLRNAVRAYAVQDPSPEQVMTRLNQMLCRLEPTETATAIVVTWNPQTAELVRASAGHPPILRCRPGEFSYLEDTTTGALLGVDESQAYQNEVKQLRPGTTLLFYTDGLIEQRGESLEDGMGALLAFVETLDDLSPGVLCNAVLEWRLGSGRHEDDICVLAVRLA